LLWRGPTSPPRASLASARAFPMRTRRQLPVATAEISRFPRKARAHMPGSQTARGRAAARAGAPVRVAFRRLEGVGTPEQTFAAQWLAYALPCQRFDARLAARPA